MNSTKAYVVLGLGIFGLLWCGGLDIGAAVRAVGANNVASQYRNAPVCADQVSESCRAQVLGTLVRYSYSVQRSGVRRPSENRYYYLDVNASKRDYSMQIDQATFDGKSFKTGQPVELEIWQNRVTMVRQTLPARSETFARAFPSLTPPPQLASDPTFTMPIVNTVEALDSPEHFAQTQTTGTIVLSIIALASAGAIIFALITLRRSRESRAATG